MEDIQTKKEVTRVKFIGYEELGNKGKPKLKDCLEHKKYDGQDKIVNYLKNTRTTKALCVATGIPKDIFTNESIKMERICLSDGVYAWSNILAYYVEKYNLRLPEEFEQHILNAK